MLGWVQLSLGEGHKLPAQDWWYPGWSPAQDSASRPAARCALVEEFAQWRTRLEEALRLIRDPERASRMLDSTVLRQRGLRPTVEYDQPTQVHLLLCGGQASSGTLIDLAFLLRSLDHQLTRTAWIACRASAEPEQARLYALLKEIVHFGREAHGYDLLWGAGQRLRPQSAVLEHCYLQDCPAEQVADFLCKDLFLGDFSQPRRSLRLNQQSQASGPFSSLALTRLRLPQAALGEAAAAQMAQQLLSVIEGGPVPPSSSGSGLLSDERSCVDAWLQYFLQAGLSQLERWYEDSWKALQRGSQNPLLQLERILEGGQTWLEQQVLSGFGERRRQLVEQEQKKLRALGRARIEQGSWSLRQWQGHLPELAKQWRRWQDSLRRSVASLIELQRELLGVLARLKADLKRAKARPNWDGRRSLVVAHHMRLILDLHLGTPERPGIFAARLGQEAHQEAVHLCQDLVHWVSSPHGELATELDALVGQFQFHQEQFSARVEQLAPWQSWPGCLTLCSRSDLEQVGQRYLDPDSLLAKLRALGLEASLQADSYQRQALALCRPPATRMLLDYSVDAHGSRIRAELEELLKSPVHQSSQGLHLWVVPALPKALPALDSALAQRRREEMLAELPPPRGSLLEVASPEEVFLCSEAVGFELPFCFPVKQWRRAYLHHYGLGAALHIDSRDQQFADLLPLDPQEKAAWRQSYEVFVLGQLLGNLSCWEGDWVWRCGPQFHPLGSQQRLLFRLTHAPRLRQSLWSWAQQDLAHWLEEGPRPERLEIIAEYKRKLWELSPQTPELEILQALETRLESAWVKV